MIPRSFRWPLFAVLVAGCALYSDVSISPLIFDPTNINHGGDLQSMIRKSDLNRAVALASVIDAKPRHSAEELAALGAAELDAGRYDDARRHLREAISLEPFRTVYADAAWQLSQVEFMCNNFDSSLDWARMAKDHGINVAPWHLEYLKALSNVDVYQFPDVTTERVPMKMGFPDVPRIDIRLDDRKTISGIVDSGAVLSIISESLAKSLPVRLLGNFEGTFAGLLGEPIGVRFGMLQTLEIGRMKVVNVPVAIMPDDKMKFLVSGKKEFKIDFLLGANFLKEFRTDFDFHRRRITFHRVPQDLRRPAPDQNLYIRQFRPAIRATVNRHGWYLFLLDTGSEITFLNQEQLRSLPIQMFGPEMHNATLQGLGGAQKHGDKVADVEIGVDRWAGTFRTIPMYDAGPNENATGILGENYLKNFDVTIDFGTMRVETAPEGAALMDEKMTQTPLPAAGRLPP